MSKSHPREYVPSKHLKSSYSKNDKGLTFRSFVQLCAGSEEMKLQREATDYLANKEKRLHNLPRK